MTRQETNLAALEAFSADPSNSAAANAALKMWADEKIRTLRQQRDSWDDNLERKLCPNCWGDTTEADGDELGSCLTCNTETGVGVGTLLLTDAEKRVRERKQTR